MNGYPIQYLNGIDSESKSDFMEVVFGTELLAGIGLGSAEDNDAVMLNYLRKTRDLIIKAPEAVSSVLEPGDALKMFNYAIENWSDPSKREQALEYLIKLEDKLMSEGKYFMGGFDDDDELGNLGAKKKSGFWSKVKTAVKSVGNAAKKAAKFVVRVNPLTIAARAGILAAMKINLNKMSAKIGPAYLTQAQAQKEGISAENHKKAVDALKKVEDMYVKTLQGKKEALKKAILSGKRKEWRGKSAEKEDEITAVVSRNIHESKDVMDGLGVEPVTTAATAAAATPFIVKIWNWTKGLFVSSDGKPTDISKAAVNKLVNKEKEEEIISEEVEEKSQSAPNMENTTLKKLTNPKTLAVVGGVVLLGIVGYNLMKKKSSPAPTYAHKTIGAGLDGVKKRKKRKSSPAKKKAKTTKTTKTTKARRTKVKSLKIK